LQVIYRENNHQMARRFLGADVYTAAMESFVIVCVDAVIIDPQRQTFWLPKRKALPINFPWVIGGRRSAGETSRQAICRKFWEETSLGAAPERFIYERQAEFIYARRQQEPQHIGGHALTDQFAIALFPPEREQVSQSLNAQEYHREFGLREFSRSSLMSVDWDCQEWRRAMLELYDTVFDRL
jgi:8-oxo-dGTP pyrophosphatase MutT (NUDIX family)